MQRYKYFLIFCFNINLIIKNKLSFKLHNSHATIFTCLDKLEFIIKNNIKLNFNF